MFNKFKELFGTENLLDEAFATTLQMIQFDFEMYVASQKTLRASDTAKLPFDIRQKDRQINKYEREVRRKVLTHLTIAGTQNLVPGLALVSIVIDVERIGDYTKNIADLANMYEEKLHGGQFEETLQQIESVIVQNFPKVIDVLQTHNEEEARQVLDIEEETGKKAESIVSSMILARDSRIKAPDAVSLAMYSRYLKRINAHLTNIASSIVNPFPRIGFREKKQD